MQWTVQKGTTKHNFKVLLKGFHSVALGCSKKQKIMEAVAWRKKKTAWELMVCIKLLCEGSVLVKFLFLESLKNFFLCWQALCLKHTDTLNRTRLICFRLFSLHSNPVLSLVANPVTLSVITCHNDYLKNLGGINTISNLGGINTISNASRCGNVVTAWWHLLNPVHSLISHPLTQQITQCFSPTVPQESCGTSLHAEQQIVTPGLHLWL